MKRVLEILGGAHRLKTNECDEEIYQSGQFLDEYAGISYLWRFWPKWTHFKSWHTVVNEHMAGDKQQAKVSVECG